MKKVDFRKVEIETIDGEKTTANVAQQLGNQLYMQGQNIEECELGREIYKAGKVKADKDSFVELSDEQVAIVRKFIQPWSYVLRTAVESILK